MHRKYLRLSGHLFQANDPVPLRGDAQLSFKAQGLSVGEVFCAVV